MSCGMNIQSSMCHSMRLLWERSMVSQRRSEHEKSTMRTCFVKIYHNRADRQTGQAWVRSFREE